MLRNILTILLISFGTSIFAQSSVSIKSVQKISNTSGGLGSVISSGGRFGNRIANMGDLDGNGVIDIAVGEEYADDGGLDKGAVWILFLKSDGTVKSKQKISQTSGGLGLTLATGTRFGFSVANIGDLDADGVPELAVGSIVENSYSGAVWILFMKSDGTVKSTAKIDKYTSNFTSLDNNDNFGYDIASAGDINNDGTDDMAIGAFQDDDGATDKGAVYIIFLKSDGSVKDYQKISATSGNFTGSLDYSDKFGGAVTGMGDINADGVPDIAVGSQNDDDGNTDAGAVYIITLKNDGTVKSYTKISNSSFNTAILSQSDYFGRSVSSAGDKNGDGINDLFVGAMSDDGSGTDVGAAYIIYLNSSQKVSSYTKFNNKTSELSAYLADFDWFGGSIENLNGFSNSDKNVFAVGAYHDDDGVADAGAVYIITLNTPGKPELENTKFTLASDTICADSFATAIVYLKNTGESAVINPNIYFVLRSDTLIKQKFTYIGTIAAGDSVNFNVKLNLYKGGITNITSYTSYSDDTIPANDTFKSSVVVTNLKPKFSVNNTCLGEKALFHNNSTFTGADTVTYSWDFGDGKLSDSINAEHIFNTAGKFPIKLTISNPRCSKTFSADIIVFPLPEISFTHDSACGTKTVNFKETITTNGETVTARMWDFGDQTNSLSTSPSHTYKDTGTYMVKLKIVTANGCTAEYSKSVYLPGMPQTGYTRRNDTLFAIAENASSYLWFKNGKPLPGATENYFVLVEDGAYTVLVKNAFACADSAASTYEYTKSYISGIVKQSNNQPLKFSIVILAKINMQDTLVEYLDTAYTDQNGAYSFTTDEKQVIIFALPTLNLYPEEIQAYYGDALTIQNASQISLSNGEYTINFSTFTRKAEQGTVTFTGKLQHCNTCEDAGENAENISLILVNDNNQPIRRLETNKNGEFMFPMLSSGTYRLWADRLLINNAIAPIFTIDTAKTNSATAAISLYDTFLSIDKIVSIEEPSTAESGFTIFPNPGNGIFKVRNPGSLSSVIYSVSALNGKTIWESEISGQPETTIDISAAASGIYILRIQTAGYLKTIRIIKK